MESSIAQFVIGTADARTLDVLVEVHPDLAQQAGTDYYASPTLKKQVPLAEHSEVSLHRFLNEVCETEVQFRELLHRRRSVEPPGGPTLGEVWKEITAETQQ